MRLKFNLLILCPALIATSLNAFASKPQIIIAQKGHIQKTLYYNGKVAPIVNVPVISPTAGVIGKMYFEYGQVVQKNQQMFTITSTKILNNLRSAKIAYLNALQNYQNTQNWQASTTYISALNSLNRAQRSYIQAHNNLEENIHLYTLGIISKDQLNQSKNTYQDDLASFHQSQESFKKVKKKGSGDFLLIKKLQYETANQKYQSLKKQVLANSITAPASGIVLIPTQANSQSNSNNNTVSGKLQVGATISYQEVLMNIGDMSGLKVSFNVPEIDINQIKKGLKATITGAGFPNITLKGTITSIGAQADQNTSGGGSLPTFPVIAAVKTLSKKANKLIRSGMDAQIAIDISKPQNNISIPIEAIHHKKNKAFVYIDNPNTQKITPIYVKTGTVGVKNVEIIQGLSVGQRVVIKGS